VPAEDPALVILVVIDSPRGVTYGGVVAAPVFRAVAAYGLARRGILPSADRDQGFVGDQPPAGGVRRPPAHPADPWNLLQPVSTTGIEIAAPGGMPSFVGLSMREALVRAHVDGWEARVEGSGYVVRQEPPPGAMPPDRRVTLHFGSDVS
jgi:cell division protein FtsI (penicillin-binding protein 3)